MSKRNRVTCCCNTTVTNGNTVSSKSHRRITYCHCIFSILSSRTSTDTSGMLTLY